MGKPQCKINIQGKNPPIYCDDIDPTQPPGRKHCEIIQADINVECKEHKDGPDTPVVQLFNGKKCWCCCSCFAYYTQIAVSQDKNKKFQYKIIQDIFRKDKVIATDAKVSKWVEREVTDMGGIAPVVQMDFMYYCKLQRDDGTIVQLITTGDHLFLRPNGLLTQAQELAMGDEVRQSDGGIAKLVMASPGQYSGGILNIGLGSYEKGDPLDGHLLNSEGIVTADLAVQLANFSDKLDSKLLHPSDPGQPRVGSTAYFNKQGQSEYLEFINDPSKWPLHFTPILDTFINIPITAFKYFTDKQAEDIQEKIGSQNMGDSAAMATTRYLFTSYSSWFKEIYYIVDWKQELPNAYYFLNYQQKYMVITGGLARILGREGLSIVLSHLAALNGGYACTGDADYRGIQIYLRTVWRDELFFDVFEYGIKQLFAVFDMIKPEHREEDPDNICSQPSIDCRKEAIMSGASMTGVPKCAVPKPDFAVEVARPNEDLSELAVSFNRNLNIPSATDPDNYTLKPASAKILEASVTKEEQNIVYLKTKGLLPDTKYKLTVENVVSQQSKPLSPGGNTVDFKTD